MFEQHFGLRENPFNSGHQMRFLYPSREHQEARAHLRYGIENREPFVLITGEVGTGKTTALYDALAEWGSKVSVALVTNSALTREEMLEEISLRFGLPLAPGVSKPQALGQLERHLLAVHNRGEHAVLLLDEAQNLAPELLEEIRLLSNLESKGERLVQIFLVGQPELEAKLGDPQLRQLRQRISVHYRLNPLSPEETAGYIHHRISVAGGNPWSAFPPEACREVYRVTHGIPREINTVATQAMITAFAENAPSVTREHVQAVARENDFKSVLGVPSDLPNEDLPMPSHEAEAAPPAAATVREAADAPVWSPPELEAAPAAASPRAASDAEVIEPELREELDAWSRAAFGLMEARRKRGAERETAESAPALPEELRFPTRAELEMRGLDADPANADLSGLPARLREKITKDIAREEHPHHALPIVLAMIATAAIAVGLVLAQRFQVIDVPVLRPIAALATPGNQSLTPVPAAVVKPVVLAAPVDTARAAADSASAPADTVRAAKQDTTRVAKGVAATVAASPATATAAVPAPAASRTAAPGPAAVTAPAQVASRAPALSAAAPGPAGVTPAATQSANATVKLTATPTPAAAAAMVYMPPATAEAPDTLVFGIGVGSYLSRDRATQERDRLSAASGLPGQVVLVNSSGTMMFRIVLGRYPSNGAATRAATAFMETYGVDEAQPLLLFRSRRR